ncbi:MAG: type IV secretory system conjugative DNA transfer family protein [Anaerolineaceae bacterium]
MKLSTEIYIEAFEAKGENSVPSFHAVTAILLSSCPSGRLRELNMLGNPIPFYSKQNDLINTLHQPDEDITYAIRYISNPHPHSFSGGTIDVCIFCKISDSSPEKARARIEEQTEQLLIQLCGTLSDYNWQVVKDPELFKRLWQPLDWQKAEIVEIRRREEMVALDSIRSSRSLGFSNSKTEAGEKPGIPVYFVHPFLPHTGQLERFLRVMLLNHAPIVFTVMLSPVRMSHLEEQAMLDEISHSEGFQPDTQPHIQRIQEQRAQMICQGLMNQLLNLQDAPFMVTISLASSEAISAPLAEAAGIAVSAPIGEGPNPLYSEPSFIQMGGYDVIEPVSEDEKKVALLNVANLKQTNWGQELAQNNLKRIRYMMAGQEAVNAFRFPEDNGIGLPGIDVHTQRTHQIPLELVQNNDLNHDQSLLLGSNNFLGVPQDVYLPNKDRLTHMYLVGQTGTGKSTLLKTMLLSDINAGRGCALIDPHGDLFEELLGMIPPERMDDVILFDPSDMEYPVGLNLLEAKDSNERFFVAREMQAIMRRLLEDQYGHMANEFSGPVFFQHMQMNMLLAMSDPGHPGTLLEFYQIYQSASYWKRWIPLKIDDPQLKEWIDSYLKNNDYTQVSRPGESSMGAYLSSKFTDFIFDPRLRGIFGQPQSTIDFQKAMNEGKILLINLAKGLLGEANSRFMGLVIMAKIQAEAMKRAKLPASERKPFYLYVDEFQSLATENFTVLLSEARKFGIGLVLANQFISQIKDERIIQSVFGNVGSFLSFRLGREDAHLIESQYLPYFDRIDLSNLPNWQIATRVTVQGKSLSPFTVQTKLPSVQYDANVAKNVREHSRSKYSTPEAKVKEMIAQSLNQAVDRDFSNHG